MDSSTLWVLGYITQLQISKNASLVLAEEQYVVHTYAPEVRVTVETFTLKDSTHPDNCFDRQVPPNPAFLILKEIVVPGASRTGRPPRTKMNRG